MELAAVALSVCLLGQVSAAEPPVSTFSEEATASAPLVPVTGPRLRLTAPTLLAELLTPRAESLPGRPLALADVLSQSNTPARQLAAVQAYWKLATALGMYYASRDEAAALKAIGANQRHDSRVGLQSSGLAASLATANARTREAELLAVAAQEELAERLAARTGLPLPLPKDLPHVGAYRTQFQTLFAGRTPPPRIKLIEHILPLRREAIEQRADAVQAAHDTLETARELHGRGELEGDLLAARQSDLAAQQTAFLQAVRHYNLEIAEYAFGAVQGPTTPGMLLSMLVKNASASSTGSAAASPTSAKPAGSSAAPTAADALRESLKNVPQARAAQAAISNASPAPEASARQTGAQRSIIPNRAPPAREAAAPEYPADLRAPATRQRRFKPLGDSARRPSQTTNEALYADLLRQPPAAGMEQLVRLLHADSSHPAPQPAAMTLTHCLTRPALADRLGMLRNYWMAREQVARYQALTNRTQQIDALGPLVLGARQAPGGPELMVHYHAVQLAAAADLADQHLELLAAEFALAVSLGQTATMLGVLPSTAPFAAYPQPGFPGPLAATRLRPAHDRAAHDGATAFPAWHAALVDRAQATLQADLARATYTQAFAAGQTSCEKVLAHIERQSAATCALLATLTHYNRAIAQHTLESAGPSASGQQIAAALMPPH